MKLKDISTIYKSGLKRKENALIVYNHYLSKEFFRKNHLVEKRKKNRLFKSMFFLLSSAIIDDRMGSS